MNKTIIVSDKMQQDYQYILTAPMGKDFDSRFKPDLTPQQMLALGVFGGKYMTDCRDEFPKDWFVNAKLCAEKYDASLNCFKVAASQSLSVWRAKGWICKDDPRGWFQWYCRYFMGRRLESEDNRQIKRWLAIQRHIAQLKNNCRSGDILCRPRQRQAILHWAYDSRKM